MRHCAEGFKSRFGFRGRAMVIAVAGAGFAWGCGGANPELVNRQVPESVRLMLPAGLRLVEPFTSWDRFKDDSDADGIEVYVQPYDAFGEPTRAGGVMLVELYAYRPASGNAEGERLELWRFPLQTEAQQRARWNRATQMYELPAILSSATSSGASQGKYVLTVTLDPPMGGRLSTRQILERPRIPIAASETSS